MRGKINILPGTFLLLALIVLLLPLRWIFAAFLAAIFHELCHLLAIWLCGGQVLEMRVGFSGAVIITSPLENRQELICALAGPIGGLFLLLFTRWIPRIALCAGFQTVYNLLPMYPLDGGRAIHCIAAILFSEKSAEKFCAWVEIAGLSMILLMGVYGTFVLRLGLLPIIVALLVFGKISCKQRKQGVQ